jgi:hypothetical protein
MAERKSARARKQEFNERNIELGRQMLKSESNSNYKFGRERSHAFRIDTKRAASLTAVAKAFGAKPEVYH